MNDDDLAPLIRDYFESGAAKEDMMYQIQCEDPIIHTAENGYECNDADCICHWERATQNEADIYGTHAWNCRCSWCEPPEGEIEPWREEF